MSLVREPGPSGLPARFAPSVNALVGPSRAGSFDLLGAAVASPGFLFLRPFSEGLSQVLKTALRSAYNRGPEAVSQLGSSAGGCPLRGVHPDPPCGVAFVVRDTRVSTYSPNPQARSRCRRNTERTKVELP